MKPEGGQTANGEGQTEEDEGQLKGDERLRAKDAMPAGRQEGQNDIDLLKENSPIDLNTLKEQTGLSNKASGRTLNRA